MADNGGFLNKLKAWVRIAGDWFKWQVNLKEAEFAYKKAEKEEQIAYVLMGSTRNAANEARATFSWAAEARTAYEKAEPAEAELQKEAWVKGSAIAAQNWVVVEARAVRYEAEYQKAKDVTEDALLKFNELKKEIRNPAFVVEKGFRLMPLKASSLVHDSKAYLIWFA